MAHTAIAGTRKHSCTANSSIWEGLIAAHAFLLKYPLGSFSYGSQYLDSRSTITPGAQATMDQYKVPCLNDLSNHHFTCIGFAPSKGRRCFNPINQPKRASIRRKIALLSTLEAGSQSTQNLFIEIAQLGLCWRHGHQVDIPVNAWNGAPITANVPDAAPEAPVMHSCSDTHVARRPVEGECIICVEDLADAPLADIVWCKSSCGQNMHKHCLEQWHSYTALGRRLRCACCRATWSLPCEHDLQVPAPTEAEQPEVLTVEYNGVDDEDAIGDSLDTSSDRGIEPLNDDRDWGLQTLFDLQDKTSIWSPTEFSGFDVLFNPRVHKRQAAFDMWTADDLGLDVLFDEFMHVDWGMSLRLLRTDEAWRAMFLAAHGAVRESKPLA